MYRRLQKLGTSHSKYIFWFGHTNNVFTIFVCPIFPPIIIITILIHGFIFVPILCLETLIFKSGPFEL